MRKNHREGRMERGSQRFMDMISSQTSQEAKVQTCIYQGFFIERGEIILKEASGGGRAGENRGIARD